MKPTEILFIAAAAVAMTLVSCTKEQTGTTENGQTSGPRTLTVSFAASPTRTTLEGMQPKWSENDEILLADGINQETHTVTAAEAGKTSFEITTSLTGAITAVYPATSADISDNTISGIKVSNTPDGEFASANICMAKAAVTEKELSFENKTAIIKVEVPEGTKKLTLTSLNPVGTSGQRASLVTGLSDLKAVAIADGSTTITVGDGSSNIPNPCYVSILAPASGAVLLQDLNIDVDDKAQGGFSPSFISAKGETPSSYAVEENTIYTLAKESLHEYVEFTITDKWDITTFKWATMNVGATASDPYGTYFMWGETTGQKPSRGTFIFPDTKYYSAENTTWDKSVGFDWANCPYTDGEYDLWNTGTVNVFTKYTDDYDKYAKSGSADGKYILDLMDDAAFWNWGGAWRMPVYKEFTKLIGVENGESTPEDFGDNGSFITANGGVIFPAAGYGSGTKLWAAGESGNYWSSSLTSGGAFYANYFRFDNSKYGSRYEYDRSWGMPVRPVSVFTTKNTEGHPDDDQDDDHPNPDHPNPDNPNPDYPNPPTPPTPGAY